MSETSIVPQLLQVLLPGRRQLRRMQSDREALAAMIRDRLLTEYQTLAALPTKTGATRSLRQFDLASFREYIECPEAANAWNEASAKVAPFQMPEMAGGVNPGDQRMIFHLTQYLKPKSVLEVGTHIGASTVHILLGLLCAGETGNARLMSVDIKDVNCEIERPWRQFGAEKSPREMIRCLSGEDLVQFCSGVPSVEYLRNDNHLYNLIFLDGDHSASAVYQELPLALNRLADGGVILLHDYFPELRPLWNNRKSECALMHADVIPGVFLAVQRFLNEGNRVQVTPFGALPWTTKLESNVTSLALISRENL